MCVCMCRYVHVTRAGNVKTLISLLSGVHYFLVASLELCLTRQVSVEVEGRRIHGGGPA